MEPLPEDLIICADRGYEILLKLGLLPHVLIGDFDSIESKYLHGVAERGVTIIEYPQAKNKTDTHLALEYAIEQGAQEVIILAALGGRIDHTWANIGLLWLAHNCGVKAKILDTTCQIFLISGKEEIRGQKGEIFSLFPVGLAAEGITIRGARFPLQDASLKYGQTLCASNEFIDESIEIEVREGTLLFMKINQKS